MFDNSGLQDFNLFDEDELKPVATLTEVKVNVPPPPEEGFLPIVNTPKVRDSVFDEVYDNDARYQERLRAEENKRLYNDSLIKEDHIKALFSAVIIRQLKDAIRLDMRLGNADDAKEGDYESVESVQQRAVDWIFFPNFTQDFEMVCQLAGLPCAKTRRRLTDFLIKNNIIDSNGVINPNANYEKTKENFNLIKQNIGDNNDDIERL